MIIAIIWITLTVLLMILFLICGLVMLIKRIGVSHTISKSDKMGNVDILAVVYFTAMGCTLIAILIIYLYDLLSSAPNQISLDTWDVIFICAMGPLIFVYYLFFKLITYIIGEKSVSAKGCEAQENSK